MRESGGRKRDERESVERERCERESGERGSGERVREKDTVTGIKERAKTEKEREDKTSGKPQREREDKKEKEMEEAENGVYSEIVQGQVQPEKSPMRCVFFFLHVIRFQCSGTPRVAFPYSPSGRRLLSGWLQCGRRSPTQGAGRHQTMPTSGSAEEKKEQDMSW